ncbi:MAG: hypothetical protein U0271_11650 [Polyangiaceae bacterium]
MSEQRRARALHRSALALAALAGLSGCDAAKSGGRSGRGGEVLSSELTSSAGPLAAGEALGPRGALDLPTLEPSLVAITPQRDLPDLDPLLGTRAEGYAPRWVTRFSRGLTPDAAGKILPGAERVSEFGFAEVRVREPKGLARVKLYFTDKGTSLANVAMLLEPRLNGPDTWKALRQAAIEKWGPSIKEDPSKHHLIWFELERGTVTVSEGISASDGYSIEFQFP